MDSASAQRFEFGGFRLDIARRRLLDRKLQPVEISAKSFDALVYLVRSAGRVVERMELMDALWPQAVVEENTLSQVVLRLRNTIGEGSIVTVKGRGYQFVEQVSVLEAPSGRGRGFTEASVSRGGLFSHRNPRLVVAAVALLLLGPVLVAGGHWYLESHSQRNAAALCAGATEIQIERLAEFPPRNERACQYYRSALDYSARAWTPDLNRSAVDQFERAIEEDNEFALAWAGLSVLHSEAYLFGADVSEARRRDALYAAERALQLQPALPEGHVALAWYRLWVEPDYQAALDAIAEAENGMPEDLVVPWLRGHALVVTGDLDRAIAAFEHAVQLNPGNVEQLWDLAIVHQLRRDYRTAESYYDRILGLRPDHVQSLVGKVWLPLLQDGDATAAKAAAENPPYPDFGHWFNVPPEYFGWLAALYARNYQAALGYLDAWEDDALEGAVDSYVPKASLYGVTHELLGQPDRADRYFRTALEEIDTKFTSPVRESELPGLYIARAEALAGLGENEAAINAAREALVLLTKQPNAMYDPEVRIDAVRRVFVPAGDFDAAIAGLEAYFAAPGFWSVEGLVRDPRIDPLRDDPEFLALVERFRRR